MRCCWLLGACDDVCCSWLLLCGRVCACCDCDLLVFGVVVWCRLALLAVVVVC